jgi:hypothetical protein
MLSDTTNVKSVIKLDIDLRGTIASGKCNSEQNFGMIKRIKIVGKIYLACQNRSPLDTTFCRNQCPTIFCHMKTQFREKKEE